jgi:hypothetical protein
MLNKLGPPFAFSIWVAARMALVHYSTIDRHISPSIYTLLDTLREMGRYWKVAGRYATLLTRVLDEYEAAEQARRNSAAATNEDGRANTPTAVKILADMRRTAFDLDFLISRQPRAVHEASWGSVLQQQGGFPPLSAGGGDHGELHASTPKQQYPPQQHVSAMDTLSAAAAAARQPLQQLQQNSNDLEYLDVFDFFNMPRLPVGFEGFNNNGGGGVGFGSGGDENGNGGTPGLQVGNGATEFNMTNYMVDANADWFVKTPLSGT